MRKIYTSSSAMLLLAATGGAALSSYGRAPIELKPTPKPELDFDMLTPEPEPEPTPAPRATFIPTGERWTVEEAMQKTGTSTPKQALDHLKKTSGRINYMPHVGAKQRAKALKRLGQ